MLWTSCLKWQVCFIMPRYHLWNLFQAGHPTHPNIFQSPFLQMNGRTVTVE